MKPFHQWKHEQVKQDGFFRPRDWYWQAYGDYCNKCRRLAKEGYSK